MLNVLPLIVLYTYFWDVLGDNLLTVYLVYGGLILYASSGFEPIAYLYPRLRERYKKLFPLYLILMMLAGVPLGIFMALLGFSLGSGEPLNLPAFMIDSWFVSDEIPPLSINEMLLGIGLASLATVLSYFGQSLILLASRSLYTQRAEMESDVRFAREVQERLLQRVDLPPDGTIQASGSSIPANALGGDFFELSKKSGVITAAVGDISGHSFGAGLLMAMCNSALTTHMQYTDSLPDMMQGINALFFAQSDRKMFATMVLVSIDVHTNRLSLCNAGHPSILRCRNGMVEELSGNRGLPIGMMHQTNWKTWSTVIQPGDAYLLYSDGLVEIRDEQGVVRDSAFFSPLVTPVLAGGGTAGEKIDEITRLVSNLDTSAQPEDDRTVVLLQF